MTVTVEIDNHCTGHWVPDHSNCSQSLQATLDYLRRDEDFSISLKFVPSDESAELNESYRGKTGATNILSFPAELPQSIATDIGFLPLGDLAICPELLEREAEEQNKSLQSHWTHILVHGLLHLLGYDHEDEAAATAMENIEIEVLKKLGISNPYLVG
ncbi:MAG: rRNA maturation RNase YbeY [Pseudomonadales bacterium]|nr:rRNA maturation RNase YbeY [Pseudomonadales bacterium]